MERKQPLNSGKMVRLPCTRFKALFSNRFHATVFIFVSSGQRRHSFFFSYRIFFGVLSLRKRGRCDRLNRGGIDCIGMARGKDDGTAFAVDERGNGEVWTDGGWVLVVVITLVVGF